MLLVQVSLVNQLYDDKYHIDRGISYLFLFDNNASVVHIFDVRWQFGLFLTRR